ncbi:uncharacterized protein LOC133525893 [Cydia pomonella]|uniref:uncharacterized protein LOC133525893 n=1 Tax=Cydia pomonella TaxID=82600 RepID=UPI002ADDF447|nr:uncharacterized protein LOC133525893 [Cydia pomonella]
MRVVALVSGGKDSCYNMMQCVGAGHTLVALANLQPQHKDELDSYMYQTVGHQGIDLYAEAMGLPLYREVISGTAVNQGKIYRPTDDDEVEDMYRLLARIKGEMDIEAVAVGAILSDYQRIRVENVCRRLGLVSLAYLWRRNQKELLQEMITSNVEAIIIKVACLGLDPNIHLGMSIRDIQPHLLLMQEKYGLNVCGEGGEYETFTLDCPLFKKRLVIDEKELIVCSDDSVAPAGYLNLKVHLEPKTQETAIELPPTVKNALDYVNDLSDTVFSDLSDIELSETELESIEKLEKEEKKKHKELNPLLNTQDSVDTDQNDSVESIGYNYDMHEHREIHPVLDHSSIYGNSHGWYYIGGIVGEGVDTALATKDAMKKLINLLTSQDMRLEDVCSVNIYMRDMGDYAALNEVYVDAFNFVNPPTRVCVQCPLPDDVGLILDAVAHKSSSQNYDPDGNSKERVTMHVQGISHWAPANIGPYSQAVKVGEVIGTCGQIALVPGSMQLLDGGARRQCALALRHLTRVVRAVCPRAHIRSVAQSVCYMTHGGIASEARRQLERRTAGAIVQYAVVGALPRGAAVEWHAWAHTDNNRFEYEETGCNVGDYKVAITRRWNYENTVAAFVCYVATGSSPSTCQLSFPSEEACVSHRARAAQMTAAEIEAVLEYALGKLLHGRPEPTAVKMRIFYQVWSAPPPARILQAARGVGARAAATAVPVLALHNAFTFLSISGLRFDE